MTATIEQRHRRAIVEEIIGAGVGVFLLAAGIAALAVLQPGFGTVWPMLLIMLGPLVFFLCFMAVGTYFENIEEDKYFPDSFRSGTDRQKKGREHHYAPGAWNP